MLRWLAVIIVAIVAVGGWYASANYSLEVHRDGTGKFQYLRLVTRDAAGAPRESAGDLPPAAPARPSIRIGTFNVDGLDDAKMANPRLADALAKIVTRFDVIAFQNIKSHNTGVLVRLIEQLRCLGRSFDFATFPTLDRDNVDCYNAFLFDLTTIEIDGSSVHSVEYPTGRFRVKPLVALFRVRGPNPSEAFTFRLINVLVDPQRAPEGLDHLAEIYRAVRDLKDDKGRTEDDNILLGDLEADPDHLGRLGRVPGLVAAITGLPTTTRGTRQADNILFDRRATTEYTDRSGVLDVVRELDLTPQEAQDVSEHLPVYGEFSSYEGGQASHAN